MSYFGQKILITGSSGFVGKYLITSLANRGAKILGVSRTSNTNSHRLRRTLNLDLSNKNQLLDAVGEFNPDYVIHLAGNKYRGKTDLDFQMVYQENVVMSLNLIEACQRLCSLKKFVFLGSCDEYGNSNLPFSETQCELPNSAYGLSKLAITKILIGIYQTKKFPAVILRPSIIYGPNQGSDMFLSALIKSVREKRDFFMSPGHQYRDFIFIDDVINAIEMTILGKNNICGHVINIAAGESVQLANLVEIVSNLFHCNAGCFIKIGAIPYRHGENMSYSVNINKAREILGWVPRINLKDGVKITIHGRQSICP